MDLIIERRAARGIEIVDLALHPVLRRAYAARGVRDSNELSLTLDKLMPVGTLDSVERGGGADPRASRAAHSRGGRLRCGRRDQHGAHRALPARLAVRVGRLPRAEPFRIRLRTHARNRRARRASEIRRSSSPSTTASRATPASRRRARAASRCWSPIIICRGAVARRRCHRESQRAGQHVRFARARGRRRRLLRDGGGAPRDRRARHGGHAAGHGFPRPRRARHGRGSRAARREQSRAGRAGHQTHSRRPRGSGHPRAARDRQTRRWPRSPRRISGSRSVRGSTPQAVSTTCRSASAACWRTPIPKRWRSPRGSMR